MLRFRSACFRSSGLGLAGLLDAVADCREILGRIWPFVFGVNYGCVPPIPPPYYVATFRLEMDPAGNGSWMDGLMMMMIMMGGRGGGGLMMVTQRGIV